MAMFSTGNAEHNKQPLNLNSEYIAASSSACYQASISIFQWRTDFEKVLFSGAGGSLSSTILLVVWPNWPVQIPNADPATTTAARRSPSVKSMYIDKE
jgi:hypothetical protein